MLQQINFSLPSDVAVVAIEGAPCGGKSSFYAQANNFITVRHGGRAAITAEAATAQRNAGIEFDTLPSLKWQAYNFCRAIMEEYLLAHALSDMDVDGPKVLFTDRSAVTGYLYDAAFEIILNSANIFNVADFTQHRYPCMIHLQTAAIGASEFYVNNKMRPESPEEAALLDDKGREIMRKLMGDKFRMIANAPCKDFADKIHQATSSLYRFLDLPEAVQHQKKFIIDEDSFSFSFFYEKVRPVYSFIEQYYLSDTVEKVRKITQDEYSVYYHVTESPATGPFRAKTEKVISKQKFDWFIKKHSGNLSKISKKRWAFTVDNHYCNLDKFIGGVMPCGCEYLLEVEPATEGVSGYSVPYVQIIRDVTDNAIFYNKIMAS